MDFHNFLARSYTILTDSGGIQEEAPSLGKPVLVMRDTTERPEEIAAGTLKLVGTDEKVIYNSFTELLSNKEAYIIRGARHPIHKEMALLVRELQMFWRNNMKIAVAGTGYVGLSLAVLLAQHNKVIAIDIIPEKVEKINNRISPIQDEYIEKYFAEKELDLTATIDAELAYKNADLVIIATHT